MNSIGIKKVIDAIKGHIIINEKVTNQILDIIKMDVDAACDFAKEVEFKDSVDDETKNRLRERICLLAMEMCIDDDQPAMDIIEFVYKRKDPFLKTLIEKIKERAEAGNGMAQYMMGCCHEKGIGLEKNPEKARSYYLSAAAKDNHGGTYYIAKEAYHHRDMNYSIALFHDLANKDDDIAKCALSYMTIMNEKNAGTDKTKAIKELRENPTTKKLLDIAFLVSYYYLMGEFVEEDEVTGFEFLHISAHLVDKSTKEQGHHLLETCLLLRFRLDILLRKLREKADNVIDYNEHPLVDFLKILEFMMNDINKNKENNETLDITDN